MASKFAPAESNEGFLKGESGYYMDIPDTEYHAVKGRASNSLLKNGIESNAKLFRAMHEKPSPPTIAQLFGTAYHLLVLEPELFDERVSVAPVCAKTKRDGDRCGNAVKWLHGGYGFCGIHRPKGMECTAIEDYEGVLLTQQKYDDLLGMRDVLHGHEYASMLLEGEFREGVAFWDYEFTDPVTSEKILVPSKAKVDHRSETFNALVDIKTTKNASEHAFAKAIFEYCYWTQGPIYIDAMNSLGDPVEDFIIIAQEKEAPYDMGVYKLDEDTMRFGRMVVNELYRRYIMVKEGDRQSYSKDVVSINIPEWGINLIERRLFENKIEAVL